MTSKYEAVKDYYDSGVWSEKRVRDAVMREWITAEEYKRITGHNYE